MNRSAWPLRAYPAISSKFSAYRRWRAEQLSRRLGMFTVEQQVAALQPLESAPSQDTRAIVAPLLRSARAESAAVTPADPPPDR